MIVFKTDRNTAEDIGQKKKVVRVIGEGENIVRKGEGETTNGRGRSGEGEKM